MTVKKEHVYKQILQVQEVDVIKKQAEKILKIINTWQKKYGACGM